MNQTKWILVSGTSWLGVGLFLLYKGTCWLQGVLLEHPYLFIASYLIVGQLKARYVLSKTVLRVVAYLHTKKNPIRFIDAYQKSYWILISAMICLGILLRFLPIASEWKAWVDLAIGFALINGSFQFFKAAWNLQEDL